MNNCLSYVVKKILWVIPVLIGITFFAFSLGLAAGGDPASVRANADINYIPPQEEVEALREEMGLNDPILVQYGRWISGVFHGDLGYSYIDNKSVLGELIRLLPNTLLLSVMALIVCISVGLLGGVLLAWFRDTFFDVFGRMLLVVFLSVPGFCLAYFMIWIFAQKLRILPTSGAESMTHFIMPCIAVAISSACVAARLLRSSILGELGKNYIMTAQAKGLSRQKVIFHHALRNALVPAITYTANTFGGLVGGSMITETVFSVPGIGSYALAAINNRDYMALQGYVLFTGFAYVMIGLMSDLLCGILNPQICLGNKI